LDDILKALLSKETSFKPIERMEGSRVSESYVQFLSSLGLHEKAKTATEGFEGTATR
jgi:hypothetical protein